MSRVIITVGPAPGGKLCFHVRRAPIPPADLVPIEMACTVAQLPTGKPPPPPNGWVRDYGKRLWSELIRHPEAQRALTNAVDGPPGRVQSVMFDLQATQAEQFNWEMLCDDQDRFLALERAPIGRIAEERVDQAGAPPAFTGDLRITAVLSALGARADKEWNGLRGAMLAARAAGLRVVMRVIAGEGGLVDEIAAVAAGDPDLRVTPLPDRAVDLQREIIDSRPHILHFFCHGTAEQGQPRLHLATSQDFERLEEGQPATPGVTLHLDRMQSLLAPSGVWLVVLNCCEGGKSTEEVYSLAHSLAAAGVPAALGMRESIQAAAAYEFSRVFYLELLGALGRLLAAPDAGMVSREIDWAHVLSAPRAALVESNPADDATTSGEWTLPVLYTRSGVFTVQISAASPAGPAVPVEAEKAAEDRVTRAILEGLLNRLPPDTPPEAIAELRRIAAGQAPS
jgi:hypothetical protein